MTRRRRLLVACMSASTLALVREQVRSVERLLDEQARARRCRQRFLEQVAG